MCEFHIREMQKTTEYKQAGHYDFPRIVGVKTGNKSKLTRIREGLFPVVEKKKFAVRSTHQTFLSMLDTFPNEVFDHDYDLLDALSQGSDHWRYPVIEEDAISAKSEEQEYLKQLGKPYGYAGTFQNR